jgi:hypothetical protein
MRLGSATTLDGSSAARASVRTANELSVSANPARSSRDSLPSSMMMSMSSAA